MIIDIANCMKLKMVVIIATALALGVGAVAACVVPWFYCNPNDNADDDREVTAVRDNTISHSRSSNEHNNKPTATQVRINGFSFVKVIHVSTESSTNNDSKKSANEHSETKNSIALEEQTNNIDRTKSIQTRTSESSNFPSITDSSRNSENPTGVTNESSGSSESAINNIRIIEQSLEKSVSSDDPSLIIKVEEILTDTRQSLSLTDESTTGTTARTLSCISTLGNSMLTDQTNDQTTEPINSSNNEKSGNLKLSNKERLNIEKKFESFDRRSTKVKFLEPEILDRIEEDTSTYSQKYDPSNFIDDRFIETNNDSSSSQESKNSLGQTKVAVVAIIETSKSTKVSEEISVAPSRLASTQDATTSTLSSQNVLPKINKQSQRNIRDEVSSTSTISSWNSRSKILSSAVPMAMCPMSSDCRTPNSTESTSYSRPCTDTKIISLFRKSLSKRIRRFFHGRKLDETLRSSREEISQPLYTDSVQSLLSGKKIPAGSSTRISEDQPHTMRSDSIKFYGDSSKSYVRDENQNVRSDTSTNVERENFDENRNRNSDTDDNVSDREKTKGKKKKRRGLFNFSKKNRSIENDKVSSSGSKRKNSNNVTVECQRNSTVTNSKSNNDFNDKIESISELPVDSDNYFAFNNDVRDDEPCTEL